MIPNIVVPMPMPMHGGMPPKALMAFAIVFAIVSVLLIVGGIIYDGVKHKIWTLHSDPEIPNGCGYMNFAKMAGYMILGVEIIVIMLMWLIKIVFNVL